MTAPTITTPRSTPTETAPASPPTEPFELVSVDAASTVEIGSETSYRVTIENRTEETQIF